MRPRTNGWNGVISAAIVAGAHLIVLWLIWKSHVARDSVVEESGTLILFSSSVPVSRRAWGIRISTLHPRPTQALSQGLSELLSAPISDVPIPAASSAPSAQGTVDWQRALESASAQLVEEALRDRTRSARFRRPQPSADLEPLHEWAHDLEWVREHSRLVISAQGVPQWILVQPCALDIFLKDPDCTVEHIERHGIAFEYIQQQHDATLGYAGPDAVP